MNAFFRCTEVGGAESPLKELSKSVSLDSISAAGLNRSLVLEIAGGREDSPAGCKDGAELGEVSSAGQKDGPEFAEVSSAGCKDGPEPGEVSSAGQKDGLEFVEVSSVGQKDGLEFVEVSSAGQKEGAELGEAPRAEWKEGSDVWEASSAEQRDSMNQERKQEEGTDSPSGKEEASEPEGGEERELTEDEINEKQREAIRDALQRLARGEELTKDEKGNLCEMMMDQYYISQGYKPLHSPRVTSLEDKGHHGIDGVYEKDGKYVIADAKYGMARLGDTQDGAQMSQDWINKRLDDAVGKEKADEIREAYENDPDSVSTQVYHYDPGADETGATRSKIYHVNENGEKDGDEATVEMYRDGERVDTSADESENGGENHGADA